MSKLEITWETKCSECGGSGDGYLSRCRSCQGKGYIPTLAGETLLNFIERHMRASEGASTSSSLHDNVPPEFTQVKDFVRPEGMTGEQVRTSVRYIEGWLEGPDYSALELAFCLFRIFRDDTSG